MKRLRTAVLGQGRSGYDIHVKWLREDQERYEIVAIADQIPERTEEAVKEFGAKAFNDYKALLADNSLNLDLVVNALPTFLHKEGTIAALNAGHNVVSEKPIACTVADFDQMVLTAKKNGKKLLPFQNSRFQPAFQKIMSIIDSGIIGRIIHARISFSNFARRWDWQTSREMSGGNLLNTGPHPMDQAIVIFGNEAPNIFARLVSDNPFGDAENFASVTLWGANKPTIEVIVSSFMAYPQGDIYNISGTHGGLTGNFTELNWKYFNTDTAPGHQKSQWSAGNREYCSEKLDWTEESWKTDPSLDMFQTLCRGFYTDAYNILTKDAPRTITLEQVHRQIAAIEEAHKQNPTLT